MEYYTVTEFAKLTGKDAGNIRRLLKYGRLVGEKLGNQWVIPKDAVYPNDERLRSGQYINWRQKSRFSKKNPKLMKALHALSIRISEIYGGDAVQITLYGSYARGEETEESDVDIAFLLRGDAGGERHEEMLDIVTDYELNLAVTLSVVPIDYEEFQKWHDVLPFYKNIEKEGIVLWRAA